MHSLLTEIQQWFDNKRNYFNIFAAVDSRIEGWFKAEMLVLLTELKERRIITDFKREARAICVKSRKRKQIDFRIQMDQTDHYCELKACCISQAAGTPRDLTFYFRDDHVGLIKDFRKLDNLSFTNKWVLAFIYPSPSAASWSAVAKGIPTDLSHWLPITSPPKAKEPFFVSLWKG